MHQALCFTSFTLFNPHRNPTRRVVPPSHVLDVIQGSARLANLSQVTPSQSTFGHSQPDFKYIFVTAMNKMEITMVTVKAIETDQTEEKLTVSVQLP